MSGYCPDCGNTLCLCDEFENDITVEELIDLVNMQPDEICHIKCHQRKELLRQNKIMREALEFIMENNPVETITSEDRNEMFSWQMGIRIKVNRVLKRIDNPQNEHNKNNTKENK